MAKQVKRSSESVVDSRREVALIRETLTNYRSRINENVVEIFTPYAAEGESLPDLSRFVELSLAHLERLHRDVLEFDQARIEESVQRTQARSRLEEAESALRRRVRMILTTIEGCFGEAGLVAVPFRSADAGSVDGLIDQALFMEKSLRKFQIPKDEGDAVSSAFSVMPPPEILADSLHSRIETLKEMQESYSMERQEHRAAQVSRRAALERYRRHERRTRAALKALMGLVDMEEFARVLHVKPSPSSAGTDDPPTSEGDPPFSQAA